jgi:hypothetical protein
VTFLQQGLNRPQQVQINVSQMRVTHNENSNNALYASTSMSQFDSQMKIRDSVAFVTGANSGLGHGCAF